MTKRNRYNSVSLQQHFDQLREADQRALTIKQTADEYALTLAREIQAYRDEQHNGLLKQLSDERAHYVSQDQLTSGVEKLEALVKPLTEFMVSQIAAGAGVHDYRDEQREQRTSRFESPARANYAVLIALAAALSSVSSMVFVILHG
jgi:hypothetical protein